MVRQLEETIGQRALLSGLSALMDRYNHSTITLDDLVRSWSESSGRDLRRWAAQALITPDRARTE